MQISLPKLLPLVANSHISNAQKNMTNMQQSEEIFKKIFNEKLIKKLVGLGFQEIKIKDDWIHPAFLFEKNGIWFGASWDYRDMILEIDLGKLYFFEDVMPKVIIRGSYNVYLKIKGIITKEMQDFVKFEDFFEFKFNEVTDTIDEILENIETYLAKEQEYIIKLNSDKKGRKRLREYFSHLGKETRKEDLPIQ